MLISSKNAFFRHSSPVSHTQPLISRWQNESSPEIWMTDPLMTQPMPKLRWIAFAGGTSGEGLTNFRSTSEGCCRSLVSRSWQIPRKLLGQENPLMTRWERRGEQLVLTNAVTCVFALSNAFGRTNLRRRQKRTFIRDREDWR